MTRTAGAPIGCQRPSRFWGLGCPKIFHEAEDTLAERFHRGFLPQADRGHLQPVLDTLKYLKHETDVWFEITNLLIPGHNDSEDDLKRMLDWIVTELGPDVPLHFSAFHPDYKMLDVPPTSPQSLTQAREMVMA